MQIACEKCATVYVLDDRLLPPGGAPVQCTRCGHVFVASAGPPKAQTQVFGKVAPVVAPGGNGRPQTQLFGRTAPPNAARSPTTALPASPQESGPQPAPNGRTATQNLSPVESSAFGSLTSTPRAKTQSFDAAMSAGTIIRTRVPQPEAAPASATLSFERPADSPLGVAPAGAIRSATEIFGAPFAPGGAGPPSASVRELLSSSLELDTDRKGRSPRAPAPFSPPVGMGLPHVDLSQETDRSGEGTSGRGRSVLRWIVVLLLLAGAAFLGQRFWAQRQTEGVERSRGEVEKTFLLVRKDDPSSRTRAIDELERLSQDSALQLEAQADLIVALSLAKDDALLAGKYLEERTKVLQARISRLEKKKSLSDWEVRVNAMLDQLKTLKEEREPLAAQAGALQARLVRQYNALPQSAVGLSPAEEKALTRAQMIFQGVSGSAQAVALAERYRQFDKRDGWAEIAVAEYALNAVVPPMTLEQARQGVDAVISRDSAFLRAYVLSARLSLAQKKPEQAAGALNIIVILNPAHSLAQKLLAWADEARDAEVGIPR